MQTNNVLQLFLKRIIVIYVITAMESFVIKYFLSEIMKLPNTYIIYTCVRK